LAALLLTACGERQETPRLDQVEPAQVTALAATPATLSGRHLYARARVDLDEDTTILDREWKIAIGDAGLADDAVTWIDPTRIDMIVPPGLPVGAHDVVATAPDGRVVVLTDGVTVTDEPIGLTLTIEDAAGGAGAPLTGTFSAGDSVAAYAVARDRAGDFVADVDVVWSVTGAIGTTLGGPASETSFTATRIGVGHLVARRDAAGIETESGELVVVAGPADRIAIVDAPGGAGATIGDLGGLTTDADGGLDAHAISVDAFDNFVADEAVTWSLSGVAGVLPAASTSRATVDFTTTGTGVLHAIHPTLAPGATGTLTVIGGRAATLAISPAPVTISADAPPLALLTSGTDADGNATQDLGTLGWTVVSGPIRAIDSAGVLDPITAGAGTIRVTSSHGSSADVAVTILAGRAAVIEVQPPSAMLSADDAPLTFTVKAADGDGNLTADVGTVSWSIAAGPITAIGPSTGIFDPARAGTGAIRATSSWGPSGDASVTVTEGIAASLVVTPDTLDRVAGEAPVSFVVAGTDADGNPTTKLGAITWSIASGGFGTLDAAGVLTPTVPGLGTVRATSSFGPFDDTSTVRVRQPATLVAAVTAPTRVTTGQSFAVSMRVDNVGESGAAGVTPCGWASTGAGGATASAGPTPSSAAIAAGGAQTFAWTFTAGATGPVQLTGCAMGTDVTTSAPAGTPGASSSITVEAPPVLVATLTIPPLIGTGATFPVDLAVHNTGQATASGVTPVIPTVTGTASATLVSAPVPAAIAGGATATFRWIYRATAPGTLQLTSAASGTDANSGAAVTSNTATSDVADVLESLLVAADPFGDGSAFAYVVGYQGSVVLGPNRNGTRAARFPPGGGPVELLDFRFPRDTTGNSSRNSSPAPYRSIGATGCTANTAACGPDNEDGRGQLEAVTFGGTQFLVISGARTGGDLDYVYMTTDTDTTLDFRYVDLSTALGGGTVGVSAIAATANRCYLGFPDGGGSRPYLLGLETTPPSPGLDATSFQVVDLEAKDMPNFQTTGAEIVDAIANVGGLIHVFQDGGWMRAAVATPRSYRDFPSDWRVMTPSSSQYSSLTSITTTKFADLLPTDRAVPQAAVFGGRLFVARNTTAGPQLWSCNPAGPPDTTACDPGDWTLIARNAVGNTLLSQFDDTTRTRVTMLVATPTHLYVGFDDADGAVVYRTSDPAATTLADFTGRLGCTADQGPTMCPGLGGAGFGATTNTRILDADALTFGGASAVYVTTGDGSGPLSVYVLP